MQLQQTDVPSLKCLCVQYFAVKHYRYFAIKDVLPKIFLQKIQDLRVEIGIFIRIHRIFCDIPPELIVITEDLTVDWSESAKRCYPLVNDKNAFAFAAVNVLEQKLKSAWDRLKHATGPKRSLNRCLSVRLGAFAVENDWKQVLGCLSCLNAAQDGFPLLYKHSFANALHTVDSPEILNQKYYVMYYFYKAILHRNYHLVDFISTNVGTLCYHKMHKFLMQNNENFVANLTRVPRRYQTKTLSLLRSFFKWNLEKYVMQYRILLDDFRFQKNSDFVEAVFHLIPCVYGCYVD